ncbi:hypothetical protein IEO21_10671 [Rhodonia placenta]|uniref:Uncharacterized protein n=1 Tax=Rhodonia placenta TaxID=104341 RepID=A0A8H7TX79_9APHY|nr:hypothetical protein IEO21_10671 [Postia placenta]
MVDSGDTMKFINKQFITEHKVQTRKLKEPIPLYNIDGTLNKDGSISKVAVLQMQIGEHIEKTVFTVTDIGSKDVIVRLDWLREHNPEIDWENSSLKLSVTVSLILPTFSAISADISKGLGTYPYLSVRIWVHLHI